MGKSRTGFREKCRQERESAPRSIQRCAHGIRAWFAGGRAISWLFLGAAIRGLPVGVGWGFLAPMENGQPDLAAERRTWPLKQFALSPAAGKRLIAKGLAAHPEVLAAATSATLVIVAGTTNGYVAEELLGVLGVSEDFDRQRFFRGVTLPPKARTAEPAPAQVGRGFPGDVVIRQGRWLKGKTLFDVAGELQRGDVILIVDVVERNTLLVGLEKRVPGSLDAVAELLNAPGAEGLRLLPVPGSVYTELDAIRQLTGATATLVAAGGICGAEGSVWLAVRGTGEQLEQAQQLLKPLLSEPVFAM